MLLMGVSSRSGAGQCAGALFLIYERGASRIDEKLRSNINRLLIQGVI